MHLNEHHRERKAKKKTETGKTAERDLIILESN